MSFSVNISHIWSAYRLLKTYAYYENLNLYLKERIAEFETRFIHSYVQQIKYEKFSEQENIGLDEIGYEIFEQYILTKPEHPFNKIIQVLNDNNPAQNAIFQEWLQLIDFNLMAKSVDCSEFKQSTEGLFLTNKKTAPSYYINKINYFINAPIELHIIEIIWTSLVGNKIDSTLTNDCYGNRIGEEFKKYHESFYKPNNLIRHHGELFKRYINQYNNWRDGALKTARTLTENNNHVAIFSLDIKSYFYNIDINFEDIKNLVEGKEPQSNLNFELKLCDVLALIHDEYSKKINPYLEQSHADQKNTNVLPIGFASSSVLANLYLSSLDFDIAHNIRPAYYGRYVDDLIFVFKDPNWQQDNIEGFIKTYFSGFISNSEISGSYVLNAKYKDLPIQRDKIILHYFDKDHTLAGLEVFQKEIEERSSAFRFLPDEHVNTDLEKCAYDLLYDGSANKFRSIVGLAENETELSKYLATHIIAHRLCKVDTKHNPIPKIERFFKGVNALRFSRLWEKVFSYAIIKGGQERIEFATKLRNEILNLIDKTSFRIEEDKPIADKLSEKLKEDLRKYLDISVCMPLALLETKQASNTILSHNDPMWIFQYSELTKNLRLSNLFRHSYVSWPLINFTNYNESFCDPDVFRKNKNITISRISLDLSPRFIHFEEWQIFHAYTRVHSDSFQNNIFDDFVNETKTSYQEKWFTNNLPIEIKEDDGRGGINIKRIKLGNSGDTESNILVAIANLRVNEADIEDAYRSDRSPNISIERQQDLFAILNQAEKHKVKLLILPEVSIPVSWLPFIVAHARRQQIGIVFGLEHWVTNGKAYNLIVEALPFKVSNKYKSCLVTIRNKNHYAPEEKKNLESYRLIPAEPQNTDHCYNLINWSGIQMASYNCFELANIEHRSLFRSELDILAACVWNKDTSYYDHILESAARDLFCYVIQSNTSQYGGSCVLQPSRSVEAQIIKVKGGENSCILTAKLDIKNLRYAQYQSIRDKGKTNLKPTPPGYNHDSVLTR